MTPADPPVDSVSAHLSLGELLLERNRAVILAFEFLWGLAMPLVYYSTVIPGYLKHLGVENAWIGVAPAVHNGILALVQPLSAYAIRAGKRRVPVIRGIYSLSAVGYLVLGLLALRGPLDAPLALAAVAFAELMFALCAGMGDPHYLGITSDAVPARQRSFYFGARFVSLSLGGIAGGALADAVLRSAPAPVNFGRCFFLGGGLYVVSTLIMTLYRERDLAPEEPRGRLGAYLRERILGLARQPVFGRFLVSAALFALAATIYPFLGNLIRDRLGESDRIYGTLGGVFMGAGLVGSWLLGWLGQRQGARRTLALATLLFAAGVAGCVIFQHPLAVYGAYACASLWFPGQLVVGTDLALHLAPRAAAAEVGGTMMVALALPRLAGPFLAGAALDRWGPMPALGAALGCALASVLVLLLMVPETAGEG